MAAPRRCVSICGCQRQRGCVAGADGPVAEGRSVEPSGARAHAGALPRRPVVFRRRAGRSVFTIRRCSAAIDRAAAPSAWPRPWTTAREPRLRTPQITGEARSWLVDLACRKAKVPRTIRMSCGRRSCWRGTRANTVRRRAMPALPGWPRARCASCLDRHAVKPHKVRYYLERRNPEFKQKTWPRSCASTARLRLLKQAGGARPQEAGEAVSSDHLVATKSQPGVQAMAGTTATRSRPPVPGVHQGFAPS